MVAAVVLFNLGHVPLSGPFAIASLVCMAFFVRSKEYLKDFAFTLWILASATACMYYPSAFISWGGFELKRLIVPVIQFIMFGMGTTLCLGDFARVMKMPRAILIGMFLQFTVMPTVGLLVARTLELDPAVAVGVILVGCCPGGVASNVITYIARGNVALSVTMTACSTIASPLITPLIMKLLAQQYTEIDFVGMMIAILKMVFIPVVAGLIANKLLHKYSEWRDRFLPFCSMAGLCFSIAIITALSRDMLLTAGLALFAAAVIHNAVGYACGYFGAKALRLDETSCRTIAIEVGLQNAGMASGIAIRVLDSAKAALGPAIFGAWMNVSGSILASFWRRK
jgi:BASS family bile acid:Na+ symporter